MNIILMRVTFFRVLECRGCGEHLFQFISFKFSEGYFTTTMMKMATSAP